MDILIIFYSESNWPTYIWLLVEVPRLEKQMALLIHRCACRLHSSIIGLHYFNWTAKIHTCPNVSNQLLHAPSQRPTDDLRALPTLPSARPSLSSTLLRSSLAPYKENEKMTTNYANDAENLSNNQQTDPDS